MATLRSTLTDWKFLLRVALIAAAALAIYWPVLHGDWLWDDDVDITANAITKSPTGLWSIWFQPGTQLDYYPVKASVQWVQWQLWGVDTLGYHVTNLLLHILGALLVWRLLSKFGLRFAWLGGLLFAVHPVNVESVAWIAELKNTLSLPPFLLAMCAWIDFEEHRRKRDYLLAALFFVVAMLAKTTMVMFPVIILLYAWWKRGRIGWRDLKLSAPFFGISLALGLVTLCCTYWYLQLNEQPSHPVIIGGILAKVALAGTSLAFYFTQCFFPVGQMPIYPLWTVNPPSLIQFLPWPILAGILALCWWKRKTWGRHALLGLGFFLINLAPFLGFKAIDYMRFSWVMDHFLYIPIIGLIGLTTAGWGLLQKWIPKDGRPFASVGMGVLVLALTWMSNAYAEWYINQSTLWTNTLQSNPDAWVAYNNLANGWAAAGRFDEARDAYEKALTLNPDYLEAHNNLGNVLQQTNHLDEAISQYREALRLNPHYVAAHNNLGHALWVEGKFQEALNEYQEALRVSPNYADALNNLGSALLSEGRVPEAIAQFEKVIQLNPENSSAARYNVGNALLQANRPLDAIEQYREALRTGPNLAIAHNNLGYALGQVGQFPEELEQYDEAMTIDPAFPLPHVNKGNALANHGRIPEAIQELQTALQLNPDQPEVRKNLARLQSQLKSAPQKSK